MTGRWARGRWHGARALVLAGLVLCLPGCSLLFLPPEPEPGPAAPVELAPLDNTRFVLPDAATGVVGELQVIRARAEDTFIDIALAYDLGYDELVEANPGVDPWLPGAGTEILLPTRFILPDAPRQGIVLNVAAKRLFFYPKAAAGEPVVVHSFPVSIGREGWATPVGRTRIVSKRKDPPWRVPAAIRKEHAEAGDPLPPVVPPGPDNPLGRHAMRLALPGDYLIHGTNKPAGIGIRASHGCVRMNPQHIEWLFPRAPVGLTVHIVDQPLLAGRAGDRLYVEAHPPLEERADRAAETTLADLGKRLARLAPETPVDAQRLEQVVAGRLGIPLAVGPQAEDRQVLVAAARRVTNITSQAWLDEPAPATGGGDGATR